MAIRGSLAEVGLPDVLQLLALGQKRGCLSVARPGDFGSIYLDNGRVVHAALVNRRDRLGEQLLRAGDVDAADLDAALTEQRADPAARLGELLLRRGAVVPAALARHTRAQSEEAVLEMFVWAQGTFSFEPDVRVELSTAPLPLDIASLLMEGARRSDERARIAARVGGADAVFRIVPNAPRTAAGAVDVDRVRFGDAPEPSSDERAVAAQVDGRRDVAALVDATGVSEFAVQRTLFALVEAGVVERAGAAAPRVARDAPRTGEHRNLGVAFYRASLFDEAAREFRRVVEFVAGDAQAHFYLGLIALRAGDLASAVESLETATAATGTQAVAFHALAVARGERGELAEAHAALDEAERRGLRVDGRTRTLRASLHLRAGDLAGAARALGDGSDASTPAAWHHYAALVAAREGDAERAASLLAAARATFPRSAPLLANLAALHLHRADAGAAARVATEALGEDAALAPAHKTLGDAHYRAGRHREAAEAFERALAIAPSLGAGSWLRLGNVRLREGDRAAAAVAWRRALALRPDHPIARANLDAVERDAAVQDAAL